jgi:hypothetical protein
MGKSTINHQFSIAMLVYQRDPEGIHETKHETNDPKN